MKCPNCAQEIDRGEAICPLCGVEIKVRAFNPWRAGIIALSWVLALLIFSVGVYKLYFWIDEYKLNKLYTRGSLTPTIAEVTLADGRKGHAIAYFGKDGDSVFFEDLDETIPFSGGVARLEIPDSYWFGADIEEIESADVSVSALLIRQNGDKRVLPVLRFKVIAPVSPIVVISPKTDDLAVNTSVYPIEAQVVPGSTVTVNGKNVTDIVDRAGLLSVNMNVFPIGDNSYTIIVQTPNHKQARRDIRIYRAQMEIAMEVDSTVQTKYSTNIVTITGKCEPGATVSVDTNHVPESLKQDMTAGTYSFIAKLTTIGPNVIRFRATMEGKADSVISLTINYLPTLDEYSRKAWVMDYPTLCRLFEQWTGQVFLCQGEVVDVFYDGDTQYVIMDVGPEGTAQLVVLVNLSSLGSPELGREYTAYADVGGRHMYENHYYPMLNARYLDVKAD